jgi:hypothetical protein
MGLLDMWNAAPGSDGNIRLQGLLGGLTQMGATMAQAGQMRPVGTPGPGLGDAFNAFGTGRRAAITGAMQDNQMAATQRQMAAWQDAASGAPKTPEGTQLFNAIPARNRSAIFAMGPEAGFKALSSMLTQRPVAVSPGQTLAGPDGEQTRIPYTPEDYAYRQAGRPNQSVSVNMPAQMGAIPPDHRAVYDPSGRVTHFEVIDGSKTARELAAQQAEIAEQAANTGQTVDLLDSLLKHPGLSLGTGGTGRVAGRVWGTPAYDFHTRLKQIEGRAFLQAYETLKGGGHITEIEGKKATEAIARLDPGQSEAEFRAALTELRDIAAKGRARMLARLPSGAPGAEQPQAPQPQFKDGAVAENPQTGAKLVFRGGKWEPMR